jgi:hypothetical protein
MKLKTLTAFVLATLLNQACVSTGPGTAPEPILPPGYAVFDLPGIYTDGMAMIETIPRGARIQLLETFEGSFELHRRGENRVVIRNDSMGYPGLNRSFSGEGILKGNGRAEGEAEIWIRMAGPVRRDHRKGNWTIRPATVEEIERHESRIRQLEERKRRAGML